MSIISIPADSYGLEDFYPEKTGKDKLQGKAMTKTNNETLFHLDRLLDDNTLKKVLNELGNRDPKEPSPV